MSNRIGIMGAGNISSRYLSGIRRKFPHLEVRYVADIDPARAAALAGSFDVKSHGSPADLLASDDVDVVVNLTPPTIHARTVIDTLEAGKSVYVEKPLATDRANAHLMLKAAASSAGRLGSAPDTFLGSAGQTARAAIDRGDIGEPFAASAFVVSSQAETWHPDPRFLFAPGGGPVMDMGPYYIASLINCLGPVASVAAASRIGREHLIVTAPERLVESIDVTTPTHTTGFLTLESGALVNLQFSFDVWDAQLPHIEIYGTEGTLSLPDPNEFDGNVRLRRHGETEWRTLAPVTGLFGEVGSVEQYERGLGVSDLVASLAGEPQRTNPTFAYHVLDTLLAIGDAAQSKVVVPVESTTERPTAL